MNIFLPVFMVWNFTGLLHDIDDLFTRNQVCDCTN